MYYNQHPYCKADNKNLHYPYKYMNFTNPKKWHLVEQYGGKHITRGNDTFDFQINYIDDNPSNNQTTEDYVNIPLTSKSYRTKIFIGSRLYRDCLTGIIHSDNPNEILLESFGYYKECSINETLERKFGTQNMLEAFIDYLKTEFPNVKRIVLDDNSSFFCGNERIPTYPYYLFKYGSSYYEKNYKFQIMEDSAKKTHKTNIDKCNNAILDIDDFVKNSNSKLLDGFEEFIDLISKFHTIKQLLNHKYNDVECKFLKDLILYLVKKNNITIFPTMYERIINPQQINHSKTKKSKIHASSKLSKKVYQSS